MITISWKIRKTLLTSKFFLIYSSCLVYFLSNLVSNTFILGQTVKKQKISFIKYKKNPSVVNLTLKKANDSQPSLALCNETKIYQIKMTKKYSKRKIWDFILRTTILVL